MNWNVTVDGRPHQLVLDSQMLALRGPVTAAEWVWDDITSVTYPAPFSMCLNSTNAQSIYVGFRTRFSFIYIVDEAVSPANAQKASFELVRNDYPEIAVFDGLVIGSSIVGVQLFGIGTWVSMPITLIAYAFTYRKFVVASP